MNAGQEPENAYQLVCDVKCVMSDLESSARDV